MLPRTEGAGRSTYYFSDDREASAAFESYAELVGASPTARATASARCHVLETVLRPGDVVFVPGWWWHDIENLTDTSIGFASRWAVPSVRVANPLFDRAARLNVRSFYRFAHSVVTQRIVDRHGELNLDALRPAYRGGRGVATDHTRGNAITEALGIASTVDQYYARHGATR